MILLCAVPYVDTIEPIMAPALLKSVLAQHSIESTALDLNISIVNSIEKNPNKQKILEFFFDQNVHDECIDDIVDLIDHSADQILSKKPKIVALSLLIYTCQIFTRWLCAALRARDPDIKIVIGGTGIRNFVGDDNLDFCHQLRELGLIDDFIVGDGEVSLVEYVKGNLNYPGINNINWQPVPQLNVDYYPDYDDYDFNQYTRKLIPLCDSRGCVKNCEFCDVIEYWQKYQYRTADNIWQEMTHQLDRFNIRHFSFRSSLVNGNLREFRKLMSLISDYNCGKPKSEQLSWEGYFIIRGEKHHPEDLWEKIKQSNGTLLVGVESVISNVRKNLGKTFEDEDIDHNLRLGQKFNVPLVVLMIVAYPTETLNDYEYTKNWFKERKQYAGNSVVAVNLSFAGILPGTQLARRSDDYNIKRGKVPSIWFNQNLKITSEIRRQYILDLYDICKNECGFNTMTNVHTLENISDDHY
jgi:hypothetical protein